MSTAKGRDHPGLIMPPPFFLAIAFVVAIALDWATRLNFLAPAALGSPQLWIGALICAAAIAVAVAGATEFRRTGTNVVPSQPALRLVTSGPYRFTRNPMYLGMIVMQAGLGLVFSVEWALILVPVLWLAFDRLVVAREEAYLTAKFGQQYKDFLVRTRRWI